MRLLGAELRRVRLELATPFVTAHGTVAARDVLVVRLDTDHGPGWAECAAAMEPTYWSEWVDGAHAVLRDHLLPRAFAASPLGSGRPDPAADLRDALAPVRGHPMATAALETALLDAWLRSTGVALADHLGGTRSTVVATATIGRRDDVAAAVDAAAAARAAGYRRLRLKVAPGDPVDTVRAVREAVPDVAVAVDANGAYRPDDPALDELDALGLDLIEQPTPADDLVGLAALTRRLATPVALDESIRTADDVRTAAALGAGRVVVVKAARAGGPRRGRAVARAAASAGLAAGCGGLLETGLGRAGALAVAALAECDRPADLAASDRYYTDDLTAPFVLADDGTLRVPTGPGLGVDVDDAALEARTTARDTVRPART